MSVEVVEAVRIVVGESPGGGRVNLLVVPEVCVPLCAEWDERQVGFGGGSLRLGKCASGVGELVWDWAAQSVFVEVGFCGL